MSHGLVKVYTATMASGATMTSEVDLGRAYRNVYLVIPTMATASNGMYLYTSDTSGGTYRVVMHPVINSATVGDNVYIIASGLTNAVVPLPAGLRFLKVNTDATVANGCSFKVICSD